MVFGTSKKSAHWESNTPAHGSTFAGVPINVVIDFNFDLAVPSNISITKEGKEYGVGKTTIDTNKLSMRTMIDPDIPDGTYTVVYSACWPDKSCHDGNYQFVIDRRLADGYMDFRGKKDVTIDLKEIEFFPKKVRISKFTRVTWKNTDSVEHYINSDAHPSHTFFPEQNSKALKNGDAYAVVFSNPGEYPYHCSAHAQTMTGSVLVE